MSRSGQDEYSRSVLELDYMAEAGPGLRGKSARLTFCRAFRGGGENFSGDLLTGIKMIPPSRELSKCRWKSSTAVGSSFRGGSFRVRIVEIQEGTLRGLEVEV